MSVWVKQPPAAQGGGGIVIVQPQTMIFQGAADTSGWSDADGLHLGFLANQDIRFTAGGCEAVLAHQFTNDAWIHIVATWSKGSLPAGSRACSVTRLSSGSQVKPASAADDVQVFSAVKVEDTTYFGRTSDDGYPAYFDGSLDEVAIFDRALGPSEILELHAATADPAYQ